MSEAITVTTSVLAGDRDLNKLAATHAHWVLRVALASVFIYHGLSKLMGVEQFANMMDL